MQQQHSPHLGKLLETPRENICCPECGKLLGEHIGPLFMSIFHKRQWCGPIPAWIRCEDCGGIWQNPVWDGYLAEVVMFLRQESPRAELPARDWSKVPEAKRARVGA